MGTQTVLTAVQLFRRSATESTIVRAHSSMRVMIQVAVLAFFRLPTACQSLDSSRLILRSSSPLTPNPEGRPLFKSALKGDI